MSLIPIQSVSDVITNSSTEIFIADISNTLMENVKDFSDYGSIVFFKTYDDIYNYLDEHNFYVDDLEEILEKYWESKGFCFDFNSLFLDQYSLDFFVNKIGKSQEEVWNFYKDIYKPLLGKAFYSYEDDCWHPDDVYLIEDNFTFVTRH